MRRRAPTLGALIGHAVVVLAVALPCAAQEAPSVRELLTGPQAADQQPTPGAANATPAEVSARDTPRRAVMGFVQEAGAGSWNAAARFLELPPGADAAQVARQLKAIIDHSLWIEPLRFSDDPSGYDSDGLPPNRELLGWIDTPDGARELLLARGRDGGRTVWRVAADTVTQVSPLYEALGLRKLDEIVPASLRFTVLGLAVWQWLALFTIAAGAAVAATLVTLIAARLLRVFASRTATPVDDELLKQTVGPARLLLAVAIASAALVFVPLSVPAQSVVAALRKLLAVGAVTWGVLRGVDLITRAFAWRMARHGTGGSVGLIAPARRVAKIIALMLATMVVLNNFGFNVTTLVAGLGIGGIAVALAAQKSIENLFGGLTLFADQPVRIGDFCRFGDMSGTVEDIGLRSIRIRTPDRTLVSVPNGEFINLYLENFSRRDKILFHPVLRLRRDSNPEQIRAVLSRARELLAGESAIEQGTASVFLTRIGDDGLDVSLSAYVLTSDSGRYQPLAEELYLRLLAIVAESGTDFAVPLEAVKAKPEAEADHGADSRAA